MFIPYVAMCFAVCSYAYAIYAECSYLYAVYAICSFVVPYLPYVALDMPYMPYVAMCFGAILLNILFVYRLHTILATSAFAFPMFSYQGCTTRPEESGRLVVPGVYCQISIIR